MQIDHIFIRVTPGGAEAAALREAGLIEGSGNRHPGQGTANRRFFFANAFLELLWIEDEAEVASAATAPTMLRERLSTGGDASPFGICFRPSAGVSAAAFPTFDYQPAYLPPGMAINIAADAPLSEPMWFFFAAATAPETWAAERRQPMQPAPGPGRVTALRCTRPSGASRSQAARASGITFIEGDQHLLEIVCDNEARGLRQDFRPTLPLILRY